MKRGNKLLQLLHFLMIFLRIHIEKIEKKNLIFYNGIKLMHI